MKKSLRQIFSKFKIFKSQEAKQAREDEKQRLLREAIVEKQLQMQKERQDLKKEMLEKLLEKAKEYNKKKEEEVKDNADNA